MRAAFRATLFGLIAAAFLPPVSTEGAETAIECQVVSETPTGLFVDAGSNRGVRAGDRGTIERGAERIAAIEVVRTAGSSSFVRVLSELGAGAPRAGDRAIIHIQPAATEEGAEEAKDTKEARDTTRETSSTLKDSKSEDEEFTPLLAPPKGPGLAHVEPRNIFHGELSLRQLFQLDRETDRDYSITRLGARGSVDRFGGTPWALEWSGDLSYRDGEALEETRDYRELRLHVYQLSLFRRFDDGSGLRIGRFLPRELPAVGYVDGIQGEKVLSPHFRLGGVVGLKPTRTRLGLSIHEPMAAPYLTVVAGERGGLEYSGTGGILASLYRGDPDRLAILLDQRLALGPRLSLYSTSEVDFDVAMEARRGTRLTRLDLFANYDLAEFLTLRAGLDHYERPDTQAERDLLPFEDDRFFDRGYWRYWVGSQVELPWKLTLYGEVAFIESPTDDYEPRWQATLTRTGLPLLPAGTLSLSAYNFEGIEVEGYGGRIWSHLPLVEHRLFLDAGLTYRFLDAEARSEDFTFADVAARLRWILSRSWSVGAGFSYGFGTDLERYLIDWGVSFRW